MLKTLFGQKYTKAFIDRVAWRKAQYYENRRLKLSITRKMAKLDTQRWHLHIWIDIIECGKELEEWYL